jgi:hypothetical protein
MRWYDDDSAGGWWQQWSDTSAIKFLKKIGAAESQSSNAVVGWTVTFRFKDKDQYGPLLTALAKDGRFDYAFTCEHVDNRDEWTVTVDGSWFHTLAWLTGVAASVK